jgi:Uma2 family endonuclease
LVNPAVIVEVLSPSTEGYDRGDEFTHYKSISTFSEYLLIAQHRPYVTQLVKQSGGTWTHTEFNDLDAVMKLGSLGCDLSLRELYQNVRF